MKKCLKKVLVTGSAGMLGGNIVYLLQNRYNIIGVDRVPINMPNIKIYTIDMLEKNSIEDIILNELPDIVIHCAAIVDMDACEQNHEWAYEVNAILPKRIANICDKIDSKVIYISTDAVFDGKKDCLYNETDELMPISIYGKAKLEGEKYVRVNTNNLILRTNIYGFNLGNKNSFGEWIYSSLLLNKTLTMFQDVYFSPILVNELVEIIYNCIENDISGTYHAVGTGCISKYQFAIKLKEVFGINKGNIVPISVDEFAFKAPRTKNMGLNNEKIKKELQIKIRTPEESIRYFKYLYDNRYYEELKKSNE